MVPEELSRRIKSGVTQNKKDGEKLLSLKIRNYIKNPSASLNVYIFSTQRYVQISYIIFRSNYKNSDIFSVFFRMLEEETPNLSPKKQGRPSGGLNKATIASNNMKLEAKECLLAKSEKRAKFVADNSPGMALRIRGAIEALDINCCT